MRLKNYWSMGTRGSQRVNPWEWDFGDSAITIKSRSEISPQITVAEKNLKILGVFL